MNIVSFGGGTNSTAMLIGLRDRNIKVDYILFADPGGEMPETYKHVNQMQEWLKVNNMPPITVVKRNWKMRGTTENVEMSLEEEMLKRGVLPSIAYGGFKTCSINYKLRPQEKWCRENELVKELWSRGEKVQRYIGYDFGEPYRRDNARKFDRTDKHYENVYPMVDKWLWDREKCVEVILAEGLELPGKSSCFFCPNMRKPEIIKLRQDNPDLFDRAVNMEQNADLTTVKGLGRTWTWENFIKTYEAQTNLFNVIDEQFKDDDEVGVPCGCYD